MKSGPDKGNWLWSDFDLDPWETKDAAFYGGALAALATGLAPAGYQARPEIQENIAALRAYLREGQSTQPLAQPAVPAMGVVQAARFAARRGKASDPG